MLPQEIGQIPTWEQFAAAPDDVVAQVAPATAVFSAGGSRRAAVLAGISPQSNAYVQWARQQNLATFALLFRHGVRHVIAAAITQNQLNETTPVYRERLLQWTEWGMSGPEALADYARLGWKVRLLGTESLPELQTCARRLATETVPQSDKTVWWFVAPDPESHWRHLLKVAQSNNAHSPAELRVALYGEPIPPATLFIAFGKPLFMPEQVPPLLMGALQCYWLQRPGYLTDPVVLRQILYDYAYLRPTWQEDKSRRSDEVLDNRPLWENAPTLGLGQRIGSFWFPRESSS